MVVLYQSIDHKLQRRQIVMVSRDTGLENMILYFSLEVFDPIILLTAEKASTPWIGVYGPKNLLFLWDGHEIIEVFETADQGAIS